MALNNLQRVDMPLNIETKPKERYESSYEQIVGQTDFNFVTLFTNPSAQAGYGTRSIFKRSLTGLNSDFSFS